MKDGKFEAGDIIALLFHKFSDERQWLCATEVSDKTGGGTRRLDFVAANCYFSKGLGIHAFEVKVSKPDLRRELSDPSKHNIFFDDVDTFSIVAPDYVLDPEYRALVPKNWGIYCAAVDDDGRNTLKTVRRPLALHDEKTRTVKRAFAFCLMRSIVGAVKESGEIRSRLAFEYSRGFADGKKEVNGVDWCARYDEEHKKVLCYARIIESLGVSSPYDFCDNSLEERVEKRLTEIRSDRVVATFVRRLKWEGDALFKLADDYRSILASFTKGGAE